MKGLSLFPLPFRTQPRFVVKSKSCGFSFVTSETLSPAPYIKEIKSLCFGFCIVFRNVNTSSFVKHVGRVFGVFEYLIFNRILFLNISSMRNFIEFSATFKVEPAISSLNFDQCNLFSINWFKNSLQSFFEICFIGLSFVKMRNFLT